MKGMNVWRVALYDGRWCRLPGSLLMLRPGVCTFDHEAAAGQVERDALQLLALLDHSRVHVVACQVRRAVNRT